MIRPPHPEHEATTILARHALILARLARMDAAGVTIHDHLAAARTDLELLDQRSMIDGTGRTMLAHVLARTLAGAPGSPRAANLDGGAGSLRTDEDGFPILRSDPTGDGAMQGDPGANDRRELAHHLDAIVRHLSHYLDDPVPHAAVIRRSADRAVCLALNWLPREATDTERHESTDGEPGCAAHAKLRGRKGPDRQGWWQPVAHEWRGGILGVPVALCSGCHRFAKRVGREPSADEVAHYQRVGKWPRLHEAKAS